MSTIVRVYQQADEGFIYYTPLDVWTPNECIAAMGTREHPDVDEQEFYMHEKFCRCEVRWLH